MACRFSYCCVATLAFIVASVVSAAPPASLKPLEQPLPPRAKVPTRPVGVWVRDVGPVKVILKITNDRLTSTAIFATGAEVCPVVRVTLDADYAVTKDGTLFGVIFGADATQPMYAVLFQPFAGHPFAFGWRMDGDALTVRNLKGFGSEYEELPVLGNGRYTRMDESKLQEWEKKLNGTATPMMRITRGGMTAPPTKPAPSAPPLFRHVDGKCEAPTAAPQALPVSAPETVTPNPDKLSGYQYPSGVFLNPQPATVQPEMPAMPAAPTKTAPVPNPLVGTWTRDVGAFRATFKFTPKQLVVHMHVDPTGKKDLQEVIIIVEYKLTTDGKRFEGTVIGADVKTGKEVAFSDADDTLRGAREVDDRPMRFEFRIAECLLLIRNVSFGDGKSCALLELNLPGVYALETEKTGVPSAVSKSGPVVGPFSPPPVVNSAAHHEPDTFMHPTHVIESPDILLIEVLKGVPKPAYQLEPFDVISLQLADPVPVEPLQGSYTIDGDGTIDLGTTYGGRVKIAGLTVAEAKLAVENSLAIAKLKAPKLTINLARTRSIQQIGGKHLVRPDGTIGLGTYGSVSVSGKSLADAKKAVEKHLSQYLLAPEVSVEVQGFNSKVETTWGTVSVMPPLRDGAKPETPIPPCIHEVLKKLPPVPPCIPFIFEVSRDNLEQTARIVKELEAERLERPRFYPLVGFAHTHHTTWKCTVSFTETITSDFPIPFKTTRARTEVVRVPQMTLYMYAGPEGLTAPSIEPAKVSKAADSVVPAVGTVPANPLHGIWVQDKHGMQLVLKFTEKRLCVEINTAFTVPGKEGPPARFTQSLDADYSTSPDGTVFGILTGIDINLGEGLPPETYASVKEARQKFAKANGTMFKFRTRLDGGRLTLSESRAGLFDSGRGPTGVVKSDEQALVEEIFAGRFERVIGMVPPPKPIAGAFLNQYSEDPNTRIEQLQKPQSEQRQNGTGLVPPPSTPTPKCKDCAPPLKLTPSVSEPVPPIPMSRG